MKLAVLNTAIMTTDGTYNLETVTLEVARKLAADAAAHEGIDSAVGHQSTADLLTSLLQVEVPVNRQLFTQERGQRALVFKLNDRPPEGAVLGLEELARIGYTLKVLTRLS